MLDQTALDNIRALQRPGQPDLLTRIIETYSRNAEALVSGLHRALQDGDIELVRRNAHTLKSAAANLGATALSELCRQLEECARSGDIDSGADLFERLHEEHERALAALAAERAAPSDSGKRGNEAASA
ncbi:MAG: Hpt domain-containing protein [Gammaproteobacteria bacterium]|jgi:HPt (histidine-containing phosphotransfer) domain-containing protein